MILASNRRAKFDYEIIKKFNAGIVLNGAEVKSVKNSMASIKNAYVVIEKGEAFLINSSIAIWPNAKIENYDLCRKRKLLLNRKEIRELEIGVNSKSMTIVPINLFLQRGKIKITIALARGRKKFDKREAKKREDIERQIKDDQAKRMRF